jgi:NTP pyrophosphatase (non-canonical NTP hydrolase)
MNKDMLEKIMDVMKVHAFAEQREIFVEECAEAIQAVQKCKRDVNSDEYLKAVEHLREEVADVLIMAEQMRLFLGSDKVDEIITAKLTRQINRDKGDTA